MAWNEPGGNGNNNRDPWGGGDQGPPDMDEALRKFKQRLDGMFGGGKGSGNGGSSAPSGRTFVMIAIGALILWVAMGIYQVDQQERAVVLTFGKYVRTEQPGLRWHMPIVDEVIKVNVTKVRAQSFREIMLTKDENIVEVKLSVQYLIDDPAKFVLKVRDPEISLQHATQSALRHVVGDNPMDLVLTEGRAAIAIQVQDRVQKYLTSYDTGIQVSKINVDDAQPPAQVQAAFDDVIKAREDEERLKNEAQSYANGIIPEARGQAQRQLEEANAYKEQVVAKAQGEADRFNQLLLAYREAPDVTRERLYLEAVQDVLANTSKVMVDVEGGNNMMYLPLDKIVGQSQRAQSSARSNVNGRDLRELTDAVTEQLRRDAAAARSNRGGR